MKIYYEKETIQEILTSLRKRKGLTQQEVGNFLGVSHAAISDLENSKTEVTLTTLERWAECLGKEVEVGLKNIKQTLNTNMKE